jgi:hypothetical protein
LFHTQNKNIRLFVSIIEKVFWVVRRNLRKLFVELNVKIFAPIFCLPECIKVTVWDVLKGGKKNV